MIPAHVYETSTSKPVTESHAEAHTLTPAEERLKQRWDSILRRRQLDDEEGE